MGTENFRQLNFHSKRTIKADFYFVKPREKFPQDPKINFRNLLYLCASKN